MSVYFIGGVPGVGRWALGVGIFCGARRTLNPERSTLLPAEPSTLNATESALHHYPHAAGTGIMPGVSEFTSR